MKRWSMAAMGVAALMPVAVAAVVLRAAGADGPAASSLALADVNGTWLTPKSQRALTVLMVVRQEGNRFPAYWGGKIEDCRLKMTAEEDSLLSEVVVRSEGGFVVNLVHTSPRQGMTDVVPGHAWWKTAKAQPVRGRFTSFADWKWREDRRSPAEGTSLTANFKGTFEAMGKQTPMEGQAVFFFSRKTPTFTVSATTTVPGGELGLTGSQAGPLQLRMAFESAPSETPKPPSGVKPLRPGRD